MSILYSDLHSWQKASKAQREESLKNLPEHIQSDYTFKEFTGTYNLAVFSYNETEDEFILIPGGECPVGYTIDDMFQVFQALRSSERKDAIEGGYTDEFNQSRPAQTMTFKPFMVSKRAVEDGTVKQAKQLFDEKGWRLISEAEWEYLAREGGNEIWVSVGIPKNVMTPTSREKLDLLDENGFGIIELHEECLVADFWHKDYANAPTNQSAWIDDEAEKGVSRLGHVSWQDDTELIALHPAYRMSAEASQQCQLFAVVDVVDNFETDKPKKSACSLEHIHQAIESGKNAQIKLTQMTLQEAWESSALDAEEVEAVYKLIVSQLSGDEKLQEGWITVLARMVQNKTDLFFTDGQFKDIYKKYAPSFIPFLTHKKKKIRLKASVLCLDFNNTEQSIQTYLECLKNDKDATMKASLAMGLVYLTQESKQADVISEIRSLLTHKNAVPRIWSALALYILEERDDAVVDVLISGFSIYCHEDIPWFGGKIKDACFNAIKPSKDENTEDVLKNLLAIAEKSDEVYEIIMPIAYDLAISDDQFYDDTVDTLMKLLQGKENDISKFPWAKNKLKGYDLYRPLKKVKPKDALAIKLELIKSESLAIPNEYPIRQVFDLIGLKEYGFDSYLRHVPVDARTLTEQQRSVLIQVAELPKTITSQRDTHRGDFWYCIAGGRKLPDSRNAFRRWLGLDAPSVMEKEFLFEGNSIAEPFYLWAGSNWGFNFKDNPWDILQSIMTDEELIEASLRFCCNEYPFSRNWEELLKKTKEYYSPQQILAVLNPIIEEIATEGADFCIKADIRDIITFYLELTPIGDPINKKLEKIARQLIEERNFYINKTLIREHFPDIPEPKTEVEIKLENIEANERLEYSFHYVLNYLSKQDDLKIAESFLRIAEEYNHSPFLSLAVYFVKGLKSDSYNELIKQYEPQAEKYLKGLEESKDELRSVKMIDGNEVTAELFHQNNFFSDGETFINLQLSSNKSLHKKITIHQVDKSLESAVKLINKIGKIKTPVLYLNGEPVETTKIYQMLRYEF